LAEASAEPVVNLDALTYAGNVENLAALHDDPRHRFVRGSIGDTAIVADLLAQTRPRAVINFAAESHVDRSIHGPGTFIETNVLGTFRLLEAVRAYWSELPEAERATFRFLHVSTDEVYGSLTPTAPAFTEEHRYEPNSPYSASKAASDHLVRAWHHTYGLPVLTTNCSNNYGPFQFPEKLIPVVIQSVIARKAIPVYGDGMNVRDWLYVRDHAEALWTVLGNGALGETYNIGGHNEWANLRIVELICDTIDEFAPELGGHSRQLISFVKDRLGHDRRYAIDASKIQRELGWTPAHKFEDGIRETIRWYLDHQFWVKSVLRK